MATDELMCLSRIKTKQTFSFDESIEPKRGTFFLLSSNQASVAKTIQETFGQKQDSKVDIVRSLYDTHGLQNTTCVLEDELSKTVVLLRVEGSQYIAFNPDEISAFACHAYHSAQRAFKASGMSGPVINPWERKAEKETEDWNWSELYITDEIGFVEDEETWTLRKNPPHYQLTAQKAGRVYDMHPIQQLQESNFFTPRVERGQPLDPKIQNSPSLEKKGIVHPPNSPSAFHQFRGSNPRTLTSEIAKGSPEPNPRTPTSERAKGSPESNPRTPTSETAKGNPESNPRTPTSERATGSPEPKNHHSSCCTLL